MNPTLEYRHKLGQTMKMSDRLYQTLDQVSLLPHKTLHLKTYKNTDFISFNVTFMLSHKN
jgi:hypothetical protein